MSFPTTKSQFQGKCKKCGLEYSKGTLIYKINEEYWCSNPNCNGKAEENTPPNSTNLDAKLDQIWEMCFSKASRIIDETYNEKELPDHFERKKQKLIMAQTFIKAVFGNGD